MIFANYIRLNELKKVQARIKDLEEQKYKYMCVPCNSYAAQDSRMSNITAKNYLSDYIYNFLSGYLSYEELTEKLSAYQINPDKLTELGHYLINYGENQKHVQLIDEEIQTLRQREDNLKDALGIK